MTSDVRRNAYVIWGALLAGPLVFAVIASQVGPGLRDPEGPPLEILAHLSLAFAAASVLASRVLPRLLRLPPGLPPEQVALTRNVIALALCEGSALFGLVAWMVTGSEWALVAAAMGIAGIVSCFPGDARWRSLLPQEPGRGGPGGPPRMVR